MKETKPVVICGLHRSGTTYVGRILSLTSSTYVLHEPFNPIWGLDYAPSTYTYWTKNNTNSDADEIVCKAMAFCGKFAKPTSNKCGLQKIRYQVLGGKQHFQWKLLKILKILRMPPVHIVWKDPFCTFMVDYLTRICKIKTVVMVRHPCAHYYSVNKQNWHFDIGNLIGQQELINDFGMGISEDHWEKAKNDNLVSIVLLWKIMSRMLASVGEQNDNLLLVRHEDLCMDPENEIHRICKHMGINFTLSMKKYIKITSQGSSAEAPEGQVHSFQRNSKALVNVWRENLSRDQIKTLLEIVGEDLKTFDYIE